MNKIIIIAEAGVNHNGDIETALRMVDTAARCGADAIKFQTFNPSLLATTAAPKAAYQKSATDRHETQYAMLAGLALTGKDHKRLAARCKKSKIKFLSSPFDMESIDLLCDLGVDTIKIPSGEITNLPYLEKIGKLDKKIILSTGMADLAEIRDALAVLTRSGTARHKITLLHCTTEYPAPFREINLRAMLTLQKVFSLPVGYSDHTAGMEASIAAAALGAVVIEKHFTLDKTMAGPDHKASLEPDELSALIRAVRNIEMALGNGIKKSSPSEIKNKVIARKSIVALQPISKGDLFTEKNITVKRPGNGISPMKWRKIIGHPADRDYAPDQLIKKAISHEA